MLVYDLSTNRGVRPICNIGTVLVTGATGATGLLLCQRLASLNLKVRTLVRDADRAARVLPAAVTLYEGDICSEAAVLDASRGVDTIIHLAALFRPARFSSEIYYAVNARGTANVVTAARRHSVGRLVHVSTVGVHGDVQEVPCHEDSPFNPGDDYQLSKLEGEKIVEDAIAAGLPAVICRPASIYGPGDLRHLKLFRAIRSRRFVMIGNGQTMWHPVYNGDLVEGIRLCASSPAAIGRTYILAGPDWITVRGWIEEIARSVEGTPPRWSVPAWPVLAASYACQAVCVPLSIEPPLFPRRVRFFLNNRAFSNDRAVRELGYAPQFDVVTGVQETGRWYFEQGYLD